MRLYFVQHGEAHPDSSDKERQLTDQGRIDVEKVASFFGLSGIQIPVIFHSGKTRAFQSAEIFAEIISPEYGLEEKEGLHPKDPVHPWEQRVNELDDHTMIVGHLPSIRKLISHLVTGNEETEIAEFHPGTAICLEKTDDGSWRLAWMIRPDLLLG